MIKENERKLYPDVIKGIAAILVVLGHNIQFGSGGEYYLDELYFGNWLFRIIYSFHMPLFMLISGYFFSNTLKKYTTLEILQSRIRQLVIPIIVWPLLPLGISVLKAVLVNDMGIEILLGYIKNVILDLWFLWAVFWNSVVVLIIIKLCKNPLVPFIIVSFGTLILPDAYNMALYKYMYPYFVVSFLWANNPNMFKGIKGFVLQYKWITIIVGTVFYGVLISFFNEKSYIYTTGVSVIGSNMLVHEQFLTDLFRWLIGFVGSSLLLFIVYIVMQKNNSKVNSWMGIIGAIGVNSLGIYVVDGVINKYILRRVTVGFGYNYIILLLETIFLTGICYVITRCLKKFRVSRILLLGSR